MYEKMIEQKMIDSRYNQPGLFLSQPQDSQGWVNYKLNLLEAVGGLDPFDQVKLRKQHPALQEAWDQYLVLLNICNDQF
jgi:hypothetical protein